MAITFKTKKLARTFNSCRLLDRQYGQLAGAIRRRIAFLAAAPSLAEVPHLPPTRRHALSGDRAGQFSVDLNRTMRLVFEVTDDPVPRLKDGGVDLGRVTTIRILTVEDYH